MKTAKTIAIVSQKGGVGKTTLAIHIARELFSKNKKIALVDLDPQRTLTDWAEDREQKGLKDLQAFSASIKDFLTHIDELKSQYDYIVIDTPPSVNNDIKKIIEKSDVFVLPSKASPNDLRAVAGTLELVKDKNFCFVLNETKGSKLVFEACQIMSEFGQVVAIIPSTLALVNVMAEGLTLQDKATNQTILKEFSKIVQFIKKKG